MVDQSVFLRPIITEKSFEKANRGWYTFGVGQNLNKNQARKLIEKVFNVKVEEIKSLVQKGDTKRSRRTRKLVKAPDFKKVVVKLAKDQKIDLFEAGTEK